jgi:filamentous hemagglutinin family protein
MKNLSGLQGCWKLSVVRFLVLGGRITLTVCFAIAASGNYAWGQVTSDNTLGAESSLVTSPRPGNFRIGGGATRGTNLFHSFSQFSVPTNGTAYFNNALNIQNIMTRVTGGSVSNIDGLIRANGTANLFLINPNGIIFGPNASLNIGGSFLASTASSLNFSDGTQFSATPTQTTSLLTISVPLGLQYGSNAGSIQVQGSTLQVPNGKTLALVGGNVQLNDTFLQALGGRVELGGVAGTGTVGLSIDNNDLRLSFPDGVALSDVSLTNGATVDVTAGGGGNIALNAQNLNMAGESQLLGGIDSGLGSIGSIAGDIDIKATGAINLAEGSVIDNSVLRGGVGTGGNINITTRQLLVSDGTQVSASTSAQGNGGNLIVNASEKVQVMGTSTDGRFPSRLLVGVGTRGTGTGGNLEITTPELLVSDGASVNAITRGEGKGGNLIVNVSEKVQLIGTTPDGELGGLFATTLGTGAAGTLKITTRQLLVSEGAVASASTYGSGNGGNLIVNASDSVQLTGSSRLLRSGLFARTDGDGAAGNLEITTKQLLISNGAGVSASTYGSGNGGNLIVNTSELVQLIGTTPNGQFVSSLSTETRGTGEAGDLRINTRQLKVSDGAQVSAGTFSSGHGGRLIVHASDLVQLIGTTPNGRFPSGLFTETRGTGEAGDLEISTRQLKVSDGARVSANTSSSGNGGSLIVNTSELVQLIGTTPNGRFPSGLFAATSSNSTGNGGEIKISTNNLYLTNGAVISAQSLGSGNAGDIAVSASSIRLDNRATISANTSGGQGNIHLNSVDLVLRHGSNITTNARGSSVIGGNINIDTGVLAALENSDISANSTNFRGGNVTVTAQGIFGTQFRLAPTPESDITATGADSSLNGTVTINAPDVDPSRGLANLPNEPVNVEVAQGCQAGGKQASIEFFNTGRGGLAPNPYEPLTSSDIWEDVPPPTQRAEKPAGATRASAAPAPPPDQIVEAQGWSVNEKGEVTLVAEMPASRSQSRCRLR